MNHLLRNTGLVLLFCIIPTLSLPALGQKVEIRDGVRVVQNKGEGIWGKNPRISLEKIRAIGDIEAANEEVAFYIPMDIALDAEGNLYVLDTGNHRIQKFSPDGAYLATLGRQGQGPGEFNFPGSLDIDQEGGLIVASPYGQKIQILDMSGVETGSLSLQETISEYFRAMGTDLLISAVRRQPPMPDDEEQKKTPDPLLQFMDREGKVVKTFGVPRDYKHGFVNAKGNNVRFAIGVDGFIYVAFRFQNRIDKYSPDGKILWQAERELNYDARKPLTKGTIERNASGSISMHSPQFNTCSEAVVADEGGRTWVATLARQLKDEEKAGTNISISRGDQGTTLSMKAWSEDDIPPTSNAYVLEVFDAEGVLLQRFPLNHYADVLRISGDRLYILDTVRRMQVHVYRITG
ncbi:MAG: NHL repeat-containing protein [Candidatus Aminicenantaceae bacterium]